MGIGIYPHSVVVEEVTARNHNDSPSEFGEKFEVAAQVVPGPIESIDSDGNRIAARGRAILDTQETLPLDAVITVPEQLKFPERMPVAQYPRVFQH